MAEPITHQVTIEELESWEAHGAMWRAVSVGDRQVVVELCSCFGEPMDLVASRDPSVIEFVRLRDEHRET
jgi:hypothetical protein